MLEKLAIVQSLYELLGDCRDVDTIAAELDKKLQVANSSRKKQIGEFDSNPEWYTPPEYIDMARSVMGAIDLDPASNEVAQQWIKASVFYTKEDDGYKKEWEGNVWCNPPYGRDVGLHYGAKKSEPIAKYWLERGLQLYSESKVNQVIFLVNRTGANWYRQITEKFNAICEVSVRICFYDRQGQPSKSARYYNDFLYLGKRIPQFHKVFSNVGRVLTC